VRVREIERKRYLDRLIGKESERDRKRRKRERER